MNVFEIEQYINNLESEGKDFFSISEKQNTSRIGFINRFGFLKIIVFSFVDFIMLLAKVTFDKEYAVKMNFVFIGKHFCTLEKGKYQSRFVKSVLSENIVFINHGKEHYINSIDDRKVYNVGVLVKIVGFILYKKKNNNVKNFMSHTFINNFILGKLTNTNVFTLCHYDANGLSLIFSKYRPQFKLIEIQHGSIINFYPYQKPVNFNIIDMFYVRNLKTIVFLKTHLAKKYLANYELIPYAKNNLIKKEGTHILYASTIETNGFHSNFISFLKNQELNNLNLIIRLHPREKDNKSIFETEIKKHNLSYRFDDSKNWLESNDIKNLIVISPWSSVIEEAVDNQYKTIIIDEIGRKRFADLIDNKICFYSKNLYEVLSTSIFC
jgi:hypothetical protein